MVGNALLQAQLAKLPPPTPSNKNKLASFVAEGGGHLLMKPQLPEGLVT